MPLAAFCVECGRDVWLTAQGDCVNGHSRSSLRTVRETHALPDGQPASQATNSPVGARPHRLSSTARNAIVAIACTVALIVALVGGLRFVQWRQERAYAQIMISAVDMLQRCRTDYVAADAINRSSEFPVIRQRVDQVYGVLAGAKPPPQFREVNLQLMKEARHLSASMEARANGDYSRAIQEIELANQAQAAQADAVDRLMVNR